MFKTLEISTIVPGHGSIGSDQLIDEMMEYLVFVESMALDMISSGRSIQEVDAMTIPNKYKDWWFDRFYYSNLRFAFEIAQ